MASFLSNNDVYLQENKEIWVYEQIKEAILRNEFKPGYVMVERKLAEKYNVSRSPVRQAIKKLVTEGLLTSEPGKGTIVPVYTLEDVLQVYDLLDVLQVYAIQISLKNYNQIADEELGRIIQEINKAYEVGDMITRMEWDIKFHTFIINYAGNKRLDSMFAMLIDQKRRFDITSYDDFEHGKSSNNQHEIIYQAILDRDVERAAKEITNHDQYIKKYYIDKLIMGKYNL